ncbi:hypothetical protein [Bradyrhizobium diversitatis]|uniref:Uncharacterized protein n=1 Tax=Bradyrhizobium diversitatis TaxID=2755406 RepID=A0ABS0NW56_9BRAD|nr:hypothetical protein [Bradyrhizobium diversitatis]MBH5385238.1 hypothetical protein [Bradyrhizobium diversitatis]
MRRQALTRFDSSGKTGVECDYSEILPFPSPLVGEGGAKRRMRGLSPRVELLDSDEGHTRIETPHPNAFASTDVAALSHKGRGHNNAGRARGRRRFSQSHEFRLCMILRVRTIICGGRHRTRRKGSKHDDYHINWPKTFAAIAAQIRECHGLTPRSRKYALPEISTLHRFASV